jgi:hypothetical protein
MSIDAGAVAPEKDLSPRRTHVAHAWLPGDTYERLLREANRRRRHPDQLAALLLDVILREDLVEQLIGR